MERILILYDKQDFAVASFDKLKEAEKYLNVKYGTIKTKMSKDEGFKGGCKLRWIYL